MRDDSFVGADMMRGRAAGSRMRYCENNIVDEQMCDCEKGRVQ